LWHDAPMPCDVICISRVGSSGGTDVGAVVASQLGYQLIDEQVIIKAAESSDVPVDDLLDVERRQGWLDRWMGSGLAATGIEGHAMGYVVPLSTSSNPDTRRAIIQRSIREIADQGRVVIVAHAASYTLADRPGVLRVLVTASTSTRVDRSMQANPALDRKKAEKAVADSDAARADYLKRFHKVNQELPTNYDLVLNSDVLPVDTLASLVVTAARA
jgi:cytidylate kinase